MIKKSNKGPGGLQKKLLIILLGGTSLAFTCSPFKQYDILREMREEWNDVGNQRFKRSFEGLRKRKLVIESKNKDGSINIDLTEQGAEIAAEFALEELIISKPKKWDKKWRVVLFDVPEKKRKYRDTIRYHLNRLGFIELQKSVFIHPFECFDVVLEILNFYNLNEFVCFMTVESLNKETEVKRYFSLI